MNCDYRDENGTEYNRVCSLTLRTARPERPDAPSRCITWYRETAYHADICQEVDHLFMGGRHGTHKVTGTMERAAIHFADYIENNQ